MANTGKASIVTIADGNFVLAVFLLICSLRKFSVAARIYVLGVDLTEEESALLEQFDGVKVCPADLSNKRNPTTRKGEALLLAADGDSDYVTLLDGDCLATGDISPYLTPEGSGLFARMKTPEEDGAVFANRYGSGELFGTIPSCLLDTWRIDVGERQNPAIRNTVCGGNLTLSRDYLCFARRWHEQMMKILPETRTREAHNPESEAYSQLDESVLNSLLAFSDVAPPIHRGALDADSSAHVAHLGPCNPKPWVLWRREKLKHFPVVVGLLEWAREQGYDLPPIPWTFKRSNKWLVFLAASGYECLVLAKRMVQGIIPKRTQA